MKKLKSLLSLMLVMILMLSMAGPMAFADTAPDGSKENPYTVTVTAADPVYSPSQGKYIQNGCAVVNDQTTTTLSVVPSSLLEGSVSDNGATVTAFPSDALSVDKMFQGTNGVYYKVSAVNNATISKPILTVTPDIVYFDLDKQEYVGSTASVEGLVGADEIYCSFSTQTSGNSVSITPVDVVLKNGNSDVANRYVVNTVAKTFDKPTFSITLADPVYNAGTGKYEVSRAADHTVTTIQLAGGSSSVTPIFDVTKVVINTVNGNTTADLAEEFVTLNAGTANVTAAFNIDVVSSSTEKREIHIYPNSPVNGKANGYYCLNEDGSAVTDYDVYATVYIENGVAKIDRSSVVIYSKEYPTGPDFINSFDVNLHTASNDGIADPTPSPSTPPTTPVTKTKLVIQAVDAEKAYNGYAFTPAQARGIKYADNTGLLAGHKLNTEALTITYTRRYDGVNFTDYTDVYKVGTYDKKLSIAATNVILDAANNDVTSQYDISAVNGILTIYNSGWVSPDTGDYTNMTLWIVLLAVSAVAVAAVVFIVLKKNKKK